MAESTILWADTHAHLYAEEFDAEREDMVQRAVDAGVTRLFLPNIDEDTIGSMHSLVAAFQEYCFPMMGLHPCYVKENYQEQLAIMKQYLQNGQYCGIGEIGLDLYWDKTTFERQKAAFITQLHWAHELGLAVSMHTRDATEETLLILKQLNLQGLRGVFHCFGGSLVQAQRAVELGFHLGIGGVATFKNSSLPAVLEQIDLQHLVLETDAPYLAPVPYRGKRNESAYIPLIGERVAEAKRTTVAEVARITTENARSLFKR